MTTPTPRLFGLQRTNRNFSTKEAWGKNQFNTSFPASLACYMGLEGVAPVYLTLDNSLKVQHNKIDAADLLGLNAASPELCFRFETVYSPYEALVYGKLPRTDLVTYSQNANSQTPLRGYEIKLTALPDNSTYDLNDNQYSCEIVVRPDSIVYLAASIATLYTQHSEILLETLHPVCALIHDWSEPEQVSPHYDKMQFALDTLLLMQLEAGNQSPFLIQSVWKTVGKTPILHENCLDMFVWSNFAFTRLFTTVGSVQPSINRSARSLIWLTKMLYDFAVYGKFDPKQIIDSLTYNTKNDKAFALSGRQTLQFLSCPELTRPRIPKEALRAIILGDGQNFLSPERRFDAAIVSTPGLFNYSTSPQLEEEAIHESH